MRVVNRGPDITLFSLASSMSVANEAKQFYEAELKVELEAKHRDEFVAIEPVSRSYYVARSSIEASLAAKNAHPDRKSFLIRIGHPAAFHMGSAGAP